MRTDVEPCLARCFLLLVSTFTSVPLPRHRRNLQIRVIRGELRAATFFPDERSVTSY